MENNMEENDMKQVISFFSNEEVKVVWREEDKTKGSLFCR